VLTSEKLRLPKIGDVPVRQSPLPPEPHGGAVGPAGGLGG